LLDPRRPANRMPSHFPAKRLFIAAQLAHTIADLARRVNIYHIPPNSGRRRDLRHDFRRRRACRLRRWDCSILKRIDRVDNMWFKIQYRLGETTASKISSNDHKLRQGGVGCGSGSPPLWRPGGVQQHTNHWISGKSLTRSAHALRPLPMGEVKEWLTPLLSRLYTPRPVSQSRTYADQPIYSGHEPLPNHHRRHLAPPGYRRPRHPRRRGDRSALRGFRIMVAAIPCTPTGHHPRGMATLRPAVIPALRPPYGRGRNY
jgi:hypothetical protein